MKGKNGMVKGMFIPFKANHIFESKNGKLYADFVAWKNKTPNEWSTHAIKQSFSKEVSDKMTKEERYALPFFGNLTALEDTSLSSQSVNTEPVTENNNDDVPF